MRIKWIITLLVLILLIPLVFSIECQRITAPKDIPCTIVSTYTPSGGCSGTLTIYDDKETVIQELGWDTLEPFCNATFNITDQGTYIYNSSIEDGIIIVEPEDNMTSLGIIIFLMALNIALFVLPFKVTFIKNPIHDVVVKHMMWLLGWVILAFNTTIFITLADTAGLGITQELFLFQWFFLKGIYILMIIIFIRMMKMVFDTVRDNHTRERMGEDEG